MDEHTTLTLIAHEQVELHAMRDQLLLLHAEGEALHQQALHAQALGDGEAMIALTKQHVRITREATALLTSVSQGVTQRCARRFARWSRAWVKHSGQRGP